MFALHITEPSGHGAPEVRSVVLVNTRAQRDRLVKHVNKRQADWAEFRRLNPYDVVPSSLCWYPGTTAVPLTMIQAKKLIGENEPNFVSDGWCRAYDYLPCKVWECRVYKCFENDPKVYGISA